MKYAPEGFVSKISCPIVCYFGEQKIEFSNGSEMKEYQFDKNYLITDIFAKDGIIVLQLEENLKYMLNSCGEEVYQ